MTKPPEFSIAVGHSRDTVTLAPAGEIDLVTAPLIADHLAAIAAGDVGHLVLDLEGVTFMDSNGVALLLGTWRRAAREGWTLTIARTPPVVAEVLTTCGLLDVLPFGAT
ncbi:MAG TPA: STAS domain-containing protein [Baekduia sp.]|uniref:STAS domain-containing protein n=1 Tax=Baekduia sp. TaxID=2600305 RepID=UPI002D7A1F79|nr:STAS domain-containing protein [Baekduia sp.]HET6507580.1 STAS domain-containing protein [Baekduia sp.]